jgi:LuxR family quorum-sensing transcriptional regulator LasR
MARIWLEPMHFNDFLLKMTVFDAMSRGQCMLLSSLPDSLAVRFGGNGLEEADPIGRHVARTAIPLEWEIGAISENTSPSLSYEGLKTLGITSGVSMSARAAQSFSRIDFYTRGIPGIPLPRKFSGDLFLFGYYFSEAARLLWEADNPRQVPLLTQREQECLKWSANGKTSGEIGMILGISHHTVYFHLKRAALKFNVHGTRHAISRAMDMGLIKPH